MADHEVVNVGSTGMSCGILELSRISTETNKVLYALASRLYHPSRGNPVAYFIFSDIDDLNTPSVSLRDMITHLNLGTVEISQSAENPRTGNIIIIFTWLIDHEKFKEWYKNERVKKIKNIGAN